MISDLVKTSISGTVIPIEGNDIDTDRIVPARFLKDITFEKMGDYLFRDVRYDAANNLIPHPLNNPIYKGASIMLVQNNFGCGSSREHAPQAIARHGITALVGLSFAEIFSGNCKVLGIPTVTVSKPDSDQLFALVTASPSLILTIDLAACTLSFGSSFTCDIHLNDAVRNAFLQGTWNDLILLKQNMPLTNELSSRLPYFNGYKSNKRS